MILENKWIRVVYDEVKGFFDIVNKIDAFKVFTNAFSAVILISPDEKELNLSALDSNRKSHIMKDVSDKFGNGKSLITTYTFDIGFILTLSITLYDTEPFILFQTRIKSSQKGYKLKLLSPFCLSKAQEGTLDLGTIADWRLLRQDWQSWSPIKVMRLNQPIKRPWMKIQNIITYSTQQKFKAGDYLSDNFAVIKNLDTQEFITLGFISMKDQLTQIRIQVNYKQNEVLELFALSSLGAIPLEGNQEIASEKLVLILNGMNAIQSLDYYASLVQQEMNALTWDSIPTGWCSWYYYYSHVSQDAMLRNSEFLAQHRKDLPIEHVQLDDGYLPKKHLNVLIGDWYDLNDRFSHGLTWLANEIKADGFKPGLWIAPFIVSRSSKTFQEHPDWIIRDKKGNALEVNVNPEWGLFNNFYGLDCTHPGVQEWLRTLFKTIVEKWGFQYIKLDFLYAAAMDGVLHENSMTRIQAYRKGLEIIRETVGDKTFLLGCGAPLGPSIGLVNGMRISGDTYYSFGQPFLFWFLNKFFFAGFEGLPSMMDALQTVIFRTFMHNRFWINDPDCLLVRRTHSSLKQHEIEFEVTLLGLCGGILFSSDNLLELSPEDLEYIKFLLPPIKDHATPIDLFENAPPIHLKLDVSPNPPTAPYHLVGIFNWTKKEKTILLSIEYLNLKPDVAYHVFDFWEKRYFQIRHDHRKIKPLKGHTAKLLAIRPIEDTPQLISSTFHLTQGAAEITNFKFNSNSMEISIEITKSGRNQGRLFLYLPPAYHEKELLSDASRASMFRQQDGLLGIQLRFEEKAQLTIKLMKK